MFEDDVNRLHAGVAVNPKAFANAVAATDEPPHLVVLTASNSAAHIPLLVGLVAPFVIGMSADIEDGDAIVYAARFYATVANGHSIVAAHDSGRAALKPAGLSGTEPPTLASATGADPRSTILVQSLA